MPSTDLNAFLRTQLADLKARGLYKSERRIQSPQKSGIRVNNTEVVNFCANNYLGLANHPDIVNAALEGVKTWGYGLSSVRFICGTQDIHKRCEQQIARFFGKSDSILYISCFDANGGLFEPLLSEQDAIVSDELNHASIIDGVRLCKAQRFRYKHNDMTDLKAQLQAAQGARSRIIVTDGSFSMDGTIAQLDKICDLADRYNAIVMVDDSHSTGFIGKTGRGTHEHC